MHTREENLEIGLITLAAILVIVFGFFIVKNSITGFSVLNAQNQIIARSAQHDGLITIGLIVTVFLFLKLFHVYHENLMHHNSQKK